MDRTDQGSISGFRKPTALNLSGYKFYTLSSYDPVNLEITRPRITSFEVEFGMDAMYIAHKTRSYSDEDFTFDELRDVVRESMDISNRINLTRQLSDLALDDLSVRLEQSISDEAFDFVRDRLSEYLESRDEGDESFDDDPFDDLDVNEDDFEERVATLALRSAALTAWIEHFDITFNDDEMASLLCWPAPSDGFEDEVLDEAHKRSSDDELYRLALTNKALKDILSRANIVYHDETVVDAYRRLKMSRESRKDLMRQMVYNMARQMSEEDDEF